MEFTNLRVKLKDALSLLDKFNFTVFFSKKRIGPLPFSIVVPYQSGFS